MVIDRIVPVATGFCLRNATSLLTTSIGVFCGGLSTESMTTMVAPRHSPYQICCILLLSISLCSASLVNVEVKRIIDVSSSLAITRSTITMKNAGESPVDSFMLSIHPSEADSVHDLWACDPSQSNLKALPMEPVSDKANSDSVSGKIKVSFPAPLQPGREITIDVRMDVEKVVKPVPAQLSGKDSQFIRYDGSSYFYSAYNTKTMTTTVILGSSVISSKSDLIDPSSISGKRVKMGPYSNVPAQSYRPMSLRFKHDRGFLVARRATKQLDVGHWGSIPALEEYEVTNKAADHVGEWSRLDYSDGHASAYGTAIGDVWANLPADATNVVYRDLIGNITSSKLRQPNKGKRPLQLTFRFPLMGGWQNHFWFTYDMAHEQYVKSAESGGATHVITVPIWPSLNTDLLCEQLTIRILLPEWSDAIEVDEHPSLKLEKKMDNERTSLTLFGRPVVSLTANMIRSQAKHRNSIVIRYKYNPVMKWVSPLLTVLATLLFITLLVTCVKTGLDVDDDHQYPVKVKTT